MKGYILVDVHNSEVFVSRNVKFFDLEFPFHSLSLNHVPNTHIYIDSRHDLSVKLPDDTYICNKDTSSEDISKDNVVTDDIEQSDHADENVELIPLRKSQRISKTPSHLQDYVCHSPAYPITNYVSYSQLAPQHQAYALSISHAIEPSTFHHASQDSRWLAAMQTEIEALNVNNTWEFVELPSDAIAIGNKWVYKIRRHVDGSIERFKARLMAQGYTQTEGLDYFETFSPFSKMSTIRVILALASIHGWHLHQLDVNNAFLHGDLHKVVYMKVPQGVTSPKPGQVCKLLKSLYGLKQASRQWFEKLTQFLYAQGFIQATSDHTLFIKSNAFSFTALLVYVDDVILAGTSLTEFDELKLALDQTFRIKNLGQLKFFLGIEVARSSKGISLCQRKYCLELLVDAKLTICKPANTPLDPSSRLHLDGGSAYHDVVAYRRLVGRLLYLTTIRPHIAYATQQLSQFMASPTITHYKAALRVLRYLKRSPDRGLFFPQSSDLQLFGFNDVDWGGCIDTRKSISGYCFFIGKSLVSYVTPTFVLLFI